MSEDESRAIEEAKELLARHGYAFKNVTRVPERVRARIPTPHCYAPYVADWEMFLPYLGDADITEFMAELHEKGGLTLVGPERLWIIKSLFMQTLSLKGEVWETGCFQGGSALMLRRLEEKYAAGHAVLRLFDTFEGMPETNPDKDLHHKGDFKNTSLAAVRALVGERDWISYHPGLIPETFRGLEHSQVRFAHVDLDIHQGVLDATRFIYPRLARGGVIVYDDYGFFACPGAREAVDSFFADKPEEPLVLLTGQAIVTKL